MLHFLYKINYRLNLGVTIRQQRTDASTRFNKISFAFGINRVDVN